MVIMSLRTHIPRSFVKGNLSATTTGEAGIMKGEMKSPHEFLGADLFLQPCFS